jgi:flagellar biosynthetic protein FlhB
MSEDQDSDDKPYDPTPKRLEEARKRGEIPRSVDLTAAASYGGILAAAAVLGPVSVATLGTALIVLLDQADRLAPLMLGDGQAALTGGLLARLAWAVAPWFALPALMAVVALIAQQGFTVTGSKLAPKLDRISPIANAKQKFGRTGIFEFVKSFAKLVLYSVVLGDFLARRLDEMLGSAYLPPAAAAARMSAMAVDFMGRVLAIAVVLGAVDYLWQRAEHLRRLRMSHTEMMDELKQSEGDPHFKHKRRQRGYDIATNRMMADVPKADVVVVNPTHYAVALKWSRARGAAPVCVAKGVDEVAARIREAAALAGVPVHRDPPTARALHATVEIGQEISRDHYKAVAAAIRFADRMRAKRKGQG